MYNSGLPQYPYRFGDNDHRDTKSLVDRPDCLAALLRMLRAESGESRSWKSMACMLVPLARRRAMFSAVGDGDLSFAMF